MHVVRLHAAQHVQQRRQVGEVILEILERLFDRFADVFPGRKMQHRIERSDGKNRLNVVRDGQVGLNEREVSTRHRFNPALGRRLGVREVVHHDDLMTRTEQADAGVRSQVPEATRHENTHGDFRQYRFGYDGADGQSERTRLGLVRQIGRQLKSPAAIVLQEAKRGLPDISRWKALARPAGGRMRVVLVAIEDAFVPVVKVRDLPVDAVEVAKAIPERAQIVAPDRRRPIGNIPRLRQRRRSMHTQRLPMQPARSERRGKMMRDVRTVEVNDASRSAQAPTPRKPAPLAQAV